MVENYIKRKRKDYWSKCYLFQGSLFYTRDPESNDMLKNLAIY